MISFEEMQLQRVQEEALSSCEEYSSVQLQDKEKYAVNATHACR
jgi:hypothetical protein